VRIGPVGRALRTGVLVAAAVVTIPTTWAQTTEPPKQYSSQSSGTPQGPQSGSATAGAFSPVLDAEKQPITASTCSFPDTFTTT
jgi:hypothetical protein